MENQRMQVESAYVQAKEMYAQWGVDTDAAMAAIRRIPISIHCWQGDDVHGFESGATGAGGGTAVTGSYPGRARTPEELRDDIDMALKQIPGKHKLALHASYAETSGKQVERDSLRPEYFNNWIGWAKESGIGLDFNPTFFSHPRCEDSFTLASADPSTQSFWIEHGKRCREISAHIGKEIGRVCIDNFWMPDGYKDIPADTVAPRQRMIKALDEIFAAPFPKEHTLDALESKLFGLGLESYTVASHEFSLLYASSRNKLYTMDAGHFHPTEVISAKISAIMQFCDQMLLHVSRGVRWDSDHVVLFTDELQDIMQQIVSGGYEKRVHIATDYFDGSINRVAAWVIGTRSVLMALLKALLQPVHKLCALETEGDYTSRLALMEAFKQYPFAAVWDYYCLQESAPVREDWLSKIKRYEKEVLLKRG